MNSVKTGSLFTSRLFTAWVIFFIVSTFAATAGGWIAAEVVRRIFRALGIDVATTDNAVVILQCVVDLIVSFYTFRWTVTKFIAPGMLPVTSAEAVSNPEN